MESGVAFHHRPEKAYRHSDNIKHGIQLHSWTTYTIGRSRGWHVIIALRMHTRLDVFGRGNANISLGQHTRSDGVMHYIPSLPFGQRTLSDDVVVACHHQI